MLEAFFVTEDGLISEKEAHHYISAVLRQKARLQGNTIDEYFRNVNGIRMQMDAMKHTYSQGERGLSHSTKLFAETLELYRNHRKEYRELLEEASYILGYSFFSLYSEI